jgi:hypothetical protein
MILDIKIDFVSLFFLEGDGGGCFCLFLFINCHFLFSTTRIIYSYPFIDRDFLTFRDKKQIKNGEIGFPTIKRPSFRRW